MFDSVSSVPSPLFQDLMEAFVKSVRDSLAIILVGPVALLVLGGSPAWGQSTSEARVAELVRDAAARYAAASTEAGPRTPSQTAPSAGNAVPLTLDQAVARALEQNLDIAVERLNPQTIDLSLAQLRASYRPTVNSTVSQSNTVSLPTSQLTGGNRVQTERVVYNVGMTKAMPWYGGSMTVGWNNTRQESLGSVINTFSPQYNTTLNVSYTQPLLRNFRTNATRTQLVVTQINREISEVQLQATITTTISNVRNAYWDLVYAVQAVEVAHQSLALAEKLVEDNRTRVEIGTMAPIDIVQAQAEAATRRQAVVQVEATARTAELSLKRLIVAGTNDDLWNERLNPVDRPGFQPEPIDVEAAVRTALDKRTDLANARRQLEINDVNIRNLRNLTLPSADLVATYGLQGIGGTRYQRDSSVIGSPVTTTIPGGYTDALSLLKARDYPTWNVQLQFSYPIGQSAADANLARARLQIQQTQAQMQQLELSIATEVTNIALQVQSNLRRVEAATAARQLSEQRLQAEQSKFEVGMSTNFQVVQAQRDLADVRNSELRAMLDYRKSLVDFERVQHVSASRAGVTVISGGGSGG
jgi:outer membrane protein